eukprot:2190512-Rhodomonas_salina.1
MAHWQYFREAVSHVNEHVQDELVLALMEIVFVQDQHNDTARPPLAECVPSLCATGVMTILWMLISGMECGW